MGKTREAQLASLMIEVFTTSEFRTWLVGRVATQRFTVETFVAGPPVEVAHQMVEALQRQGLIDAEFFVDLALARPRSAQEIRAVAANWNLARQEGPVVLAPPPSLAALPDEPYPLLQPYEHPATFGGRRADVALLLKLLARDRVVWTLHAPSGAGKSSLLRAGLLPVLWGQTGEPPTPVAWEIHPATGGLAQRLLGQLVLRPPAVADTEFERFTAYLSQVREVGGVRPILILDQFEEVFGRPALGWLGPLIAATALVPGGPVARWVLAYRREFHGHVEEWLGNLASYTPGLSFARRVALNIDLSDDRHRVPWALPLLGDPRQAPDALAAATAAFADAILRPLRLVGDDGMPRYAIRFPAEDAHCLAEAFGRAILNKPAEPLTPELQVVLNHLIEDSPRGGEHVLSVPTDPAAVDALISDAIGAHLRRRLDDVAGKGDPATLRDRRTAVILLLGRLVDEEGRRRPVAMAELAKDLDGRGKDLLTALQRPGAWLIRQELRDDVLCAILPHDRVAAEIFRITRDAAEIQRHGLHLPLVERWRFVVQRAAAWLAGDADATELTGQRFRELNLGLALGGLPWDETTRAWWTAVQAARARTARRWMRLAAGLLVLLAMFLVVVWVKVDTKLTESAVRSDPPASGDPLRALHKLQYQYHYDGAELAEVLGGTMGGFDADKRDEILGVGPAGLSEMERQEILPPLVGALAGHVEGATNPESFYGALLAAAGTVRPVDQTALAAVRAAMVASRGNPPTIDPTDGSWSPVITGTFQIGCFQDAGDTCQSDETVHTVRLSPYRIRRHEEMLGEYRAFDKDYQVDHHLSDDIPVVSINWYEAMAYAIWRGAALPTEAQWEVAARGGSTRDYRKTAYYDGNSEDDLARIGTYLGNQWKVIREVGLARMLTDEETSRMFPDAPPHPLGLINIHGNQFEWNSDWYAQYPTEPSADPTGPAVPPNAASAWRSLRGGSWGGTPINARSAYRDRNVPSATYYALGFRLAIPQAITAKAPNP